MEKMNNNEEVKRLNPTTNVLRELFLKSGNLCAFPDCSHVIMNKDGKMIAQICHIEAAEEGGERFNPNQSNEERRAFSNLMLMCYPHHVETNDLAKYDVKRMKEMKNAHEQKVTEFIEKTLYSVADQTKLNTPRTATNSGKLAQAMGWDRTPAELEQDAQVVNRLLENLKKVPKSARQMLCVIIERATAIKSHSDFVPVNEIQMACSLDSGTLEDLGNVLEKYGLVNIQERGDVGRVCFELREWDSWSILSDFAAFSKLGHATLEELIVNLNFSLLDTDLGHEAQA